MIKELHLRNVGPAPCFDVAFASRLNLITGDNGLGKSFLLDVAWWALTGNWANYMALPSFSEVEEKFDSKKAVAETSAPLAEITYQFAGKSGLAEGFTSCYDFLAEIWPRPPGQPPVAGLVIYSRADGGFSVWDPARNYWKAASGRGFDQPDRPAAYHFRSTQVWDGVKLGSEVICNGLLRDWFNWQREPEQRRSSRFNLLRRVLQVLSPPELPGGISPGKKLMRVKEYGILDIPTLETPYGLVPVTHASAGMQRIMELAYLLVWAWSEHVAKCKEQRQEPAERLLLLIDEVEAHLHPAWQLAILPSILTLANEMQIRSARLKSKPQSPKGSVEESNLQILACTHSPLVLASIEPFFKEDQDQLLSFEAEWPKVSLELKTWAKQGNVMNWLASDMFDLQGGRSRQANQAISAADAWMRGDDLSGYPPELRTKEGIHAALLNALPVHDEYWPLWIVGREKQDK